MNAPMTPLGMLLEISGQYQALAAVMAESPQRQLFEGLNRQFSELLGFMDSVVPPCSELREDHH